MSDGRHEVEMKFSILAIELSSNLNTKINITDLLMEGEAHAKEHV